MPDSVSVSVFDAERAYVAESTVSERVSVSVKLIDLVIHTRLKFRHMSLLWSLEYDSDSDRVCV